MHSDTSKTKQEELEALKSLAEWLGPDSYLGPWLRDAIPYFKESLTSDINPTSAMELHEQAIQDRLQALHFKKEAQLEARRLLACTQEQADQIMSNARAEADRITGRAWQAIHLAVKELER